MSRVEMKIPIAGARQQVLEGRGLSAGKKKERRIPVLSFFTGGGLMDIGFEMAGFRVVWTNEYNKTFAEIFKHAFSAWRRDGGHGDETEITNTRSITALKPKEVLSEAFPDGIPKIFGVIGGPPCPDFSQGGKKRGFKGSNGKLTHTYIKLMEKIKPTFFLLENVPGLFRYRRSRVVLDRLIRKMEKHGNFVIRHKVLNALEHGVPQYRERFFLVGFRKDYLKKMFHKKTEEWQFPWPVETKYPGLKNVRWPKTGRFGGKPKLPKRIPEELTAGFVLNKTPLPATLPNGSDMFVPKSKKFWKIREGDTSGKSFKRLHRHRFSPTAWYGNNEVHLHPWEPRRLSVRETLRLQMVPDSYVLPEKSTLSAKFKVVGNGVPCLLAKTVALSIKRAVKNVDSKNGKKRVRRKGKNG